MTRSTLERDIVAWERRALKAEKALRQRDEKIERLTGERDAFGDTLTAVGDEHKKQKNRADKAEQALAQRDEELRERLGRAVETAIATFLQADAGTQEALAAGVALAEIPTPTSLAVKAAASYIFEEGDDAQR